MYGKYECFVMQMFVSYVHPVADLNAVFCMACSLLILVKDARGNPIALAPNNTAYKRWSSHSGHKLLCKLCQTLPPPAMGARVTVFGQADYADPLDDWRCYS